MRFRILKKPITKKILLAIAVAGFGFILLNLAFIFDFLFQSLIRSLAMIFIPIDFMGEYSWVPPLMHASFVVIIGLIFWFIFRSKLGMFFKATYLMVPLAVVYATIGMFLYPWPLAVYPLGSFFGLSVLYYLHRTKQSWLYYYSLALISLAMLLMGIFGVEI